MAGAGFSKEIQGVRGLAILAVVLFHVGVPGFSGGYVGVDVFYVLSGYLITRLLWRELHHSGGLRLADFYARRARRLLPSAVLVLVACVAVTPLVLSPLESRVVMADAVAAALYVANYRFAWLQTDYLASGAGPSPLQHYWSLGVEEQYYLVWPLLLAVVAWFAVRRGASRRAAVTGTLMALTLASFALSVWLTGHDQPWAFFSLPSRAWELGLGGLASFVPSRSGRGRAISGWCGLAALVASSCLLTEATTFPGWAALLPTLGTAALLVTGAAPGGPSLVLVRGPLQVAGRYSYTWYLWHWPVLILGAAAAPGSLALPMRLLLGGASFVLAVLTTHAVETPLRFSPRLRARPRAGFALATGLTAVALVVPLAATAAVSVPLRGPNASPMAALKAVRAVHPVNAAAGLEAEVEADVERAALTTRLPANVTPSLDRAHADKALPFVNGCHLSWLDVRQPACRYGSIGARTRVLLMGDSHAAQWFPGLRAAARTHDWELQSWTKSTCPPLELALISPVLHRSYTECARWRTAALDKIRRDPPKVVVLGVARHYSSAYGFDVYGRAWLDGLSAVVREIVAAGSQVVVLGPTPKPAVDVPDCLSAHPDQVQRCTRKVSDAVDQDGEAKERAVVQQEGGRYVDVTRWLCGVSTCPVVLGDQLVYRDDNHLTTGYAAWLAPLLQQAVFG